MADPSLSTTWAATLQQGNQPQANLKRTLLDGNLEEELDTSSKDNKDVIISSVFLYEDVKYGTQLTDKGLRWTRATEIGRVHFISYTSMIGVKLVREAKNKFVLFYCSKKVGTKERVRAFCNFTSMSGPDEAKQWVQYIRAKIHNIPINQIPFKKRMTVFVNPAAGDRTALGQWDSVSVMFKIAGIDVNKLETTRKGHAYELAYNLNLMEAMDGIIVAGGNGTVNEVVNGLLARQDWDIARKIPLGVIPASGSGNGLANSLDATDPVTAAYFIIKGLTRPLDVFAVIQNQAKMYGVVSVTWCLTSAVEAESEVLRWMGAFRFQLMAFKKVLDNESYSGMLCTAPAENWAETECSDTCTLCRMSLRESEVPPTVTSTNTNETNTKPDKSSDTPQQRSGSFRRAQYNSDSEEEDKEFDNRSQDSEEERSADSEPDDDPNAKPEKVVGPHLDIIPRDFSSWPKGVAGEFMFFTAANVCRTSSKAKVAKWAHLSDGYLDLVVIRKTSRSAMLKILMEIEKGTFVKDPLVEYRKVKAFALIPDPNQAQSVKSLIGIDGERLVPDGQNSQGELNPQPVQVEVIPALINVFCAPPSQPVVVVKKKFWGLF